MTLKSQQQPNAAERCALRGSFSSSSFQADALSIRTQVQQNGTIFVCRLKNKDLMMMMNEDDEKPDETALFFAILI